MKKCLNEVNHYYSVEMSWTWFNSLLFAAAALEDYSIWIVATLHAILDTPGETQPILMVKYDLMGKLVVTVVAAGPLLSWVWLCNGALQLYEYYKGNQRVEDMAGKELD